MTTGQPETPQKLRQRAEAKSNAKPTTDPDTLSPEAIKQLVHELRVHQIELELQNEELRIKQSELDSSLARYVDLYDLAPVGYCTVSEKGLIVEVNLTAATLLSTARSALIQQPISRFIFNEDQDIYYLLRKKLFTSSEPQECELRLLKADGAFFWAHLAATTVQAEDGAPVCRMVLSDITERKQAQEALRMSQELLNTSQRLSKAGGWEWNTVTQAVYWTEKTYRIHGFMPGEMEPGSAEHINRSLACYGPEDRPIILGALQRCAEQGEPYDLELPFTSEKGSHLWVRTTAHPVFESGQVVRVIGNIVDITERKQAEDARESLRKTAEALAEVFLDLGRESQQNMDRIVRAAGEVTGSAAALYNRLDDTGCSIEVWSGHQLPPDMPRADTPQGHICYEATIHGQDRTVVIGNLEGTDYERTDPAVGKYGLKAYLGHPIHLRGVAIGALAVVDIRPRSFTPGEIGAIQMLAKAISLEEERCFAEQELRQSEERFRGILQNVDTLAVQGCALDGTVRYWNSASESFYGYAAEEALGRNLLDLIIPPAMRGDVSAAMQDMAQTGEAIPSSELELMRRDGSLIPVYSSHVMVQVSGKETEFYCIDVDLTERKQAEQALQLAASVFSTAHEGIMITGTDGTIIDVNDAFTQITGFSHDEVIGKNPRILSSGKHNAEFYAALWRDLKEKGHWYGEVWNRRKNGEVYAGMQTITTVRDPEGNARHYVSLFSDITSIKEHQRHLEHIAHYDALTILPNRVLLADRLHQAMVQARRHGSVLAVAFLDLDGFKAINDDYGHKAGDALLIAVSARMKDSLREVDTLARIGGDEFVAVLVDLASNKDSVPMLNRLLAAIAEPVHIGELTVQISASLGVTFYPQSEDIEADQLQRQADQAMYQAKVSGKNRYHVFDAVQDRSVRGHHESIEGIRSALADHEFTLYYQPKVNMRSGVVVGAEALICWQHPLKGRLAPAAFLPAIEDHPLATEIGEWVIETALTQKEIWRAAGLELPVSVNVGARQLQQPDFVQRLHALLKAHPAFRPGDLEIEVVETSVLEDIARASTVIEACRELGVTFALDDFGTGYSSLTYLKRLAVTVLKIDQSFVHDMLDDPDDLAILEGVLGLASAFRCVAIAEGVETMEHGKMLLQLGCDLAQGYGIARPMPADQVPAWAATWRSPPAWANCQQISHDNRPLLYAAVEHRAWIVAAEHYLKGERAAPPQLDPHRCRFGLWLDAERRAGRGTQPGIITIDTLHQQVHALVDELYQLRTKGRAAESVARLGELYQLREALLGQMKELE